MTIKDRIIDCVNKKRKFSVMANFYVFNDALAYDISDPDAIHILCKFNTSAFVTAEPTFGSIQSGTGLQEVIIPYNQVVAVTCLDVSDDLLNKFQQEHPADFERWKNAHHVEGISWDAAGNIKGTGYKPQPVDPAIKTTKEDGVNL